MPPSGASSAGGANPQATRAARVGEAAGSALETGKALGPAEKDAALRDNARAPAPMRPFLRRAVGDPSGFKQGIAETLARMLFPAVASLR